MIITVAPREHPVERQMNRAAGQAAVRELRDSAMAIVRRSGAPEIEVRALARALLHRAASATFEPEQEMSPLERIARNNIGVPGSCSV